mmetsp:Transcript_25788/g.49136  ORF Transcript_25788/g.49136 Transcript_25788/m.49136 type:complete len:151 (+) Transcript_25788:87-539(+)
MPGPTTCRRIVPIAITYVPTHIILSKNSNPNIIPNIIRFETSVAEKYIGATTLTGPNHVANKFFGKSNTAACERVNRRINACVKEGERELKNQSILTLDMLPNNCMITLEARATLGSHHGSFTPSFSRASGTASTAIDPTSRMPPMAEST